jgi:hypothetical protein
LPLIMIKLNFQTCFNRNSFSFFKNQLRVAGGHNAQELLAGAAGRHNT